MLLSGDAMQDTYNRLSKVTVGADPVGTVARISKEGLCVSASHVLVVDGKFIKHATAFGDQPLKLLASFPYYDIIFLQGESKGKKKVVVPAWYAPEGQTLITGAATNSPFSLFWGTFRVPL